MDEYCPHFRNLNKTHIKTFKDIQHLYVLTFPADIRGINGRWFVIVSPEGRDGHGLKSSYIKLNKLQGQGGKK